jgi:hypothetical protein
MTANKVKTICLLGQGELTCAYLVCGPDGFECAKGTGIEKAISARLRAGTMRAKGDNCDEERSVTHD